MRFTGLSEAINYHLDKKPKEMQVPISSPQSTWLTSSIPAGSDMMLDTEVEGFFKWGISTWGIDVISNETSK